MQLRALSDGDWRAASAVPGQLVLAETIRGPTAQVGRTVLWAAKRGPARIPPHGDGDATNHADSNFKS